MPVDPVCWEARSYCRAEAWLVAYELAADELSARPAHRGLSPLVGGCGRLQAVGMAGDGREAAGPRAGGRQAVRGPDVEPGPGVLRSAAGLSRRVAAGERPAGCHGQVRQTGSFGGAPWVT